MVGEVPRPGVLSPKTDRRWRWRVTGPRPAAKIGGPAMIRAARPEDVPAIHRFIRELAAFERLTDQLETSEAALGEHLFGARPCCEAWLAVEGATPVGFALCFLCYSTFKTSPCLWLEDLYVTPDARARGHGGELLRHLARVAVERGYPRLDWAVLDWNEGALGFYGRLGARVLADWRICRLEGAALRALASPGSAP